MTVIHDWESFFFLGYAGGQHLWEITTSDTADGLEARVEMGTSSGGEVSGTEYDGGSRRTGVLPGGIRAVRSPAVYELFWARMDYLLGVSDSYPLCPEWRERISEDPSLYGPIDGLCGDDYVADHPPPGA